MLPPCRLRCARFDSAYSSGIEHTSTHTKSVRAQGRAFAQLGHAREQERSEVTAGDFLFACVVKRLVESLGQQFRWNFSFAGNRNRDKQRGSQTKFALRFENLHDLPRRITP